MTWYPTENGDYIYKNASGSIASFEDGQKGMPIKTATFDIAPTLDGVSEVNVVRTGKNLWDEVWEVGSITSSGSDYPSTTRIRSKNFIPIKGGATYYCHTNGYVADICFYDKNQTFISGSYSQKTDTTVSAPMDAVYMRFCLSVAYGTTYNDDISVNYPSTDTAYHAFVSPTARTISLGQTVYGGSVTVDEDGNVKLAEGWKLYTGSWTHYASSNGFKAYRSTVTARTKDTRTAIDNIGNVYGSFSSSNMTENKIQLPAGTVTNFYLALDENEDPDDVILVYQEYDDPIPSDLDPITPITSALGVNNIWCDTGDSEIAYILEED